VAIAVKELLLKADKIKGDIYSLCDVENDLFA
jgi:hypothetical protein